MSSAKQKQFYKYDKKRFQQPVSRKDRVEYNKRLSACRESIEKWIESLPSVPIQHNIYGETTQNNNSEHSTEEEAISLDSVVQDQKTTHNLGCEITTDNLLPNRLRERKISGISCGSASRKSVKSDKIQVQSKDKQSQPTQSTLIDLSELQEEEEEEEDQTECASLLNQAIYQQEEVSIGLATFDHRSMNDPKELLESVKTPSPINIEDFKKPMQKKKWGKFYQHSIKFAYTRPN